MLEHVEAESIQSYLDSQSFDVEDEDESENKAHLQHPERSSCKNTFKNFKQTLKPTKWNLFKGKKHKSDKWTMSSHTSTPDRFTRAMTSSNKRRHSAGSVGRPIATARRSKGRSARDFRTARELMDATASPSSTANQQQLKKRKISPFMPSQIRSAKPLGSKSQAPELYRSNKALSSQRKLSVTKLADCVAGSNVSLICVVFQISPVSSVSTMYGVREISHILVGDQSKSYFKVTMWQQKARWVEKLAIGDIILLEHMPVKSWKTTAYVSTKFNSSLTVLCKPRLKDRGDVLTSVGSLNDDTATMRAWILKKHADLYSNVVPGTPQKRHRQPTTKFTKIRSLQSETIIHFRGKLLSVSSPVTHMKFGFEKISACFTDSANDELQVLFSTKCTAIASRLRRCEGHFYELRDVQVKSDNTGEMQAFFGMQSGLKQLDDEHADIKEIIRDLNSNQITKLSSITELFDSSRNSINFEYLCHFSSIIFPDTTGGGIDIKKLSPSKLHKLVYLGCCNCKRELFPDHNQVYSCQHCPPLTTTNRRTTQDGSSVEWIYRNFQVEIRSAISGKRSSATQKSDKTVLMTVPSEVAHQIFCGIDASDLRKYQLEEKISLVEKKKQFLKLVWSLLKPGNSPFRLQLSAIVVRDHNDVIKSQRFLIKSFHF